MQFPDDIGRFQPMTPAKMTRLLVETHALAEFYQKALSTERKAVRKLGKHQKSGPEFDALHDASSKATHARVMAMRGIFDHLIQIQAYDDALFVHGKYAHALDWYGGDVTTFRVIT